MKYNRNPMLSGIPEIHFTQKERTIERWTMLVLISLIFAGMILWSWYQLNGSYKYVLSSVTYYHEMNEMDMSFMMTGFGIASWYDYDLPDAPGYSQLHDTCASRDFPRATILRVSNANATIHCRVNDYGPQENTGRIIDLSSHAFKQLAPLSKGLEYVGVGEIQK